MTFDGSKIDNERFKTLTHQLPLMIQDSGEIGIMEFDIFTLDISVITSLSDKLIHADDPWYINQLV